MNPQIAAEIENLRVEMTRLDRLGFDSTNIKIRLRNLLIEAGSPLDVLNELAGFHMHYAAEPPVGYAGQPVMYGEVADTSQFSQAIRDASQEAQDATGGVQPHFGETYRQHPVHGILADFLADHGDPREHHARSPHWGQDVEHHLRHEVGLTPVGETDHPYTPESRRFVHNFGTEKEHVFPDGSRLWATPWGAGGNEFELSPSHQIPWRPTHLHTTWVPNAVGNFYHLPMSIDEFDDWVDQFPDDERARLRRTFGDRPQPEQYARRSAPTAYVEPTEQDWWDALAANPGDRNTLGVFADWAAERNHPLAELLAHLRDARTLPASWDGGRTHWFKTRGTYPSNDPNNPGAAPWTSVIPTHELRPGVSLLVAPHVATGDLHKVELSIVPPVNKEYNPAGYTWSADIPAEVGHRTAEGLEAVDPRAGHFRGHLAAAQRDRDRAHPPAEQYAAQDADDQPLGYGRTDYAGEFEALRAAIRREPQSQLHRNALADWLTEQGRDEEAALAADHQQPVGFTADGRVGPGHFYGNHFSAQDVRGYASAVADMPAFRGRKNSLNFHPDAIAAIHHAVADHRAAAGGDLLDHLPSGSVAPDLFRRRNGLRGRTSSQMTPGTPLHVHAAAAEAMGPHYFHDDADGVLHSSHDAPPEPEEQTQYAHDGPLTLGPGGDRGHRTPKGETLTTHDIQDEAGNALGDVRLHPSGSTLHVHWAGATGMASGEGRGPQGQPLGARHIRPLMAQIAGQYPDHVALSYVPAAGRLAAGQRRMQDLDDFREPAAQVRNRPKTQVSNQPAARTPAWQKAYDDAFALFADHGFAEAEANRAAGGQYSRGGTPTHYGDAEDFEAFARHVRANQQDQGARQAMSDWLRDRGRDREADHLAGPHPVGFHKGRVGPGHRRHLSPEAKRYLESVMDLGPTGVGDGWPNSWFNTHNWEAVHPDAVASAQHAVDDFFERAGPLKEVRPFVTPSADAVASVFGQARAGTNAFSGPSKVVHPADAARLDALAESFGNHTLQERDGQLHALEDDRPPAEMPEEYQAGPGVQYADGQPIQPPQPQDPAARVAQLQKWAEMWRQRGADPSHFLAEIARLTGQQGPQPPAGYQDDAGRPLAYATTMYGPADDFHTMLSSPEHNATRWGHGDHNLRQVAADAYQDEGDEESANHLRSGGHVVLTPDRRVVPGRFTHRHLDGRLAHVLETSQETGTPSVPLAAFAHVGGHEDASSGARYPAGTYRLASAMSDDPEANFAGGPWGSPSEAVFEHDHVTFPHPGVTYTHHHISELPQVMAGFYRNTVQPDAAHQHNWPAYEQALQDLEDTPTEEPAPQAGHYAKGRKFNRAPKGGASVPIPKQYRGGQFVPAHYAPPPEEEQAADPQDTGGHPMEYANRWGGKTNTYGVEPMHETVARHGFDPETPREIIEDRVRDADGEHRADIFRVLHKARRAYLGALEATPETYHQQQWFADSANGIGTGLAGGDVETPFHLAGHITSTIGTAHPQTAAAWRNVARAFGELQYLRDNHDAWRADEDYNPPGGAPAPYSHGTESRWKPNQAVTYAGGFAPADKFHLQDADDQSIFADYLAENGDPREYLARSPHTVDSAYDAVLPRPDLHLSQRMQSLAVRMASHKFPDGTEIALRQYHDALPVHVTWHGLRGLRQPHAVMSPEELSAWVAEFPDDVADGIRASAARSTPQDRRIGLKPFVIAPPTPETAS